MKQISNLSYYTQQIWQNTQNSHIKRVTYIHSKDWCQVLVWKECRNRIFLQQDIKTFAKQEDNKCRSADLQQGSNFSIDA